MRPESSRSLLILFSHHSDEGIQKLLKHMQIEEGLTVYIIL